jgi:hypothetical protein
MGYFATFCGKSDPFFRPKSYQSPLFTLNLLGDLPHAFVLESLEQTRRLLLEQQIDLAKRLREMEKLMPRKRTTEDYTIVN